MKEIKVITFDLWDTVINDDSDEAVHIGDREHNDVQGAHALAMAIQTMQTNSKTALAFCQIHV